VNYYNEHDPKAAAWLRELIRAGHIGEGKVDDRSIADVRADELAGFSQCHFFAGIGGWPLGLRLAGWPDDRPVWTGSCPCQPFSVAGKKHGTADVRHLWPVFYDLISQRAPAIVFGEQVASKDAEVWLDGVFADLEGSGYACGASDLCAAGLGAPHIRQRFYWMAHTLGYRRDNQQRVGRIEEGPRERRDQSVPSGNVERMGEPIRSGLEGHAGHGHDGSESGRLDSKSDRSTSAPSGHGDFGLGDASRGGCGIVGDATLAGSSGHAISPGWSRYDLLSCRDGKTRRIEPGSFPLADGIPGRVGLLRGYGNAIVPQLAAEFIQACEEALN
jgi:DNA (cytosine-5)-methyltransferase 1